MPFSPPSQPTGKPAPARARALGFVGLAGIVALLHGALLESPIGPLGSTRRQAAEGPQAVRMVLAPAAPAPAQAQAPAPAVTPSPTDRPARPERPPPPAPPAPEPPVVTTLTTLPSAKAEPEDSAAETLLALAPSAPQADLQPVDPAVQPAATADPAPTTASAPAAAATPADGGPPPLYPTEPPMPRTLAYRVLRGTATGVGQLRWEPTPASYTLSLQASTPEGPALDWVSRGGFDEAGLAPQRMVERQRERDMHAVNFQRDKQLISFSGPSRVAPLLRGAQDRLSWLIQLSAVAQARGAELKPGDTLRFQVASPRGDVDEWRFTVEGSVPVEAAGRQWDALKLVREPQRPYDQRVEVWLAPTASHLPLRLTWTTVPGGVPLELWLTGGIQLEM